MAGRAVRTGWLANGLFTSWAEEFSAFVAGTPPKAQKKVSKRAKRHMDEAGEIVASFCEEFHPARVEPTADEMAAFWDRCYGFKSAHLSAAIVDQLSLQNRAEWQPRLRALCLLEQCFDENSKAPRLVAMKVFDESEEVLQYLASQVTQCADKANQVLRKCAAPAPIPPIVIAKPPVAVTDTDAIKQKPPFLPEHPEPRRGHVNVRGVRRGKNPERQALLSDMGEQSPPLKDLETETTASSGDDNAKKLLEETPFDPNVPQQDSLTSGLRSHTSGQVAKVKQDSPRPPPEDRGQATIQAPPL